MGDGWREFASFGWVHAVVVCVALVGWVALVRGFRRVRGTADERRWRRVLGVSILVVNVGWVATLLTPPFWNPDVSLPLHLCDFAWMAAAWYLLGSRPLPGYLLYYWGLGLSTQSFVTPTVTDGPATIWFWMFWIPHWQIVGTALVVVCALGPRPNWCGFRLAVIVTTALFGVVTAFNVVFDTPYFFSGRGSPDSPTIIDRLGPWPLRLVWLGAIVFTLFVAMTWPWVRRAPSSSAHDAE